MSKKKKAHWIYSIDYQPSYAGVHVHARCSICGEPHYTRNGVGNPTAVYSAMFTNGDKESRIAFTKAIARDYFMIDEKPLDRYCRNCGAKMSVLDDDGMMDWED